MSQCPCLGAEFDELLAEPADGFALKARHPADLFGFALRCGLPVPEPARRGLGTRYIIAYTQTLQAGINPLSQ